MANFGRNLSSLGFIPDDHISAVRNAVEAAIANPGPNPGIEDFSARELRSGRRNVRRRDEGFNPAGDNSPFAFSNENVELEIRINQSYYEEDLRRADTIIARCVGTVRVLEITCMMPPRGDVSCLDRAIEQLSPVIGLCTNLTTILFRNCEVSNVPTLCVALNACVNLTSILFYRVKFNTTGLFRGLTARVSLRTLVFINSNDNNCMYDLGKFVQKCYGLTTLDMSENDLTAQHIQMFADGFLVEMPGFPINRALQSIILSNNRIICTNLHRLINVFDYCRDLTTVDLQNNLITPSAVVVLVTAMKTMQQLKTIVLDGNGLSNAVVTGVRVIGNNRNLIPPYVNVPDFIAFIESYGNPLQDQEF